MLVKQQPTATHPTDWLQTCLSHRRSNSSCSSSWVWRTSDASLGSYLKTLLTTSEVSWTNAKSSSVKSEWKKWRDVEWQEPNSRFGSAVCWERCGLTALFQRYTASVNWKPGLSAATRQDQIPEADRKKAAQNQLNRKLYSIYYNNIKIHWLHVSPNCQQIYCVSFELAQRFKVFLHETQLVNTKFYLLRYFYQCIGYSRNNSILFTCIHSVSPWSCLQRNTAI